MSSVWSEIEPLLPLIERPARYINHELGAVYKGGAEDSAGVSVASALDGEATGAVGSEEPVNFRFCMAYPDTYELGQPNQAIRILVNSVNKVRGMEAQRAYVPAPDMIDLMRERNIPAFSLERCMPLGEFDAVGITLPHDLAATNALELLDLANIPIRACDRAEDDPIIFAGGPCTYNPAPYEPFFDAFLIGEGEESLPEACCVVRDMRAAGAPRAKILQALATQVAGTYVPALYDHLSAEDAQVAGAWAVPKSEAPPTIHKRVYEGFAQSSGWEPNIVPYAEVVHDRLNVEVLRGCARGCRFCQAGMMYRPIRERSADNIVESVRCGLKETGYDEVSLTSLSTTDHSQIKEILTRLNAEFEGRGIRISVPSQRLDSFGVEMANLVAGAKKGGLTFAPEAGTQRLRDIINKNVTEQDLFSAVEAAAAAGWRRCKLYFMIGLPQETDEDLRGIAALSDAVLDRMRAELPKEERGAVQVSISCALFVPKAHTPFQWCGQISKAEAARRVNVVRDAVRRRAVRVTWHDPKTSFIEAVMSRADVRVAALVEEAWKRGARFDAWSEHFNEDAWMDAAQALDLDLDKIAQTSYEPDYVMPWAHISCGVSQKFLALEYKRALLGETTQDCTFSSCTACGTCPALHTQNTLASPRSV